MERRDFLSSLGGALAAAGVPTVAAAVEAQPETVPAGVTPEGIHLFDDFELMVDTIRAHVAQTGDRILSADHPKQLRIGFCVADGPRVIAWEARMMVLKDFLDQDTNQANTIRELFKTAAGRARFAEFLSATPRSSGSPYR